MNKVKYIYLVLALCGATIFSSCEDEELSSKELRVWVSTQLLPNNTFDYQFVGNLVDGRIDYTSSPSAKFPARISRPISENVTVHFELNHSEEALAAYNAANGTAYELLPMEAIAFSNPQVTIRAGETLSKDSITIDLLPKSISAKKFYWLSARLSSIESKDKGIQQAAQNEMATVYITVRGAGEVTIVDGGDMNTIATPIERTNWTITASRYPQNAPKMLDGNLATYWDGISARQHFTVDMKEETSLTGLSFTPVSYKEYGDDETYWAQFKDVEVFTSNDGSVFTSIGRIKLVERKQPDIHASLRFAPTKCRYFRVQVLSNYGYKYRCGELNAYSYGK